MQIGLETFIVMTATIMKLVITMVEIVVIVFQKWDHCRHFNSAHVLNVCVMLLKQIYALFDVFSYASFKNR